MLATPLGYIIYNMPPLTNALSSISNWDKPNIQTQLQSQRTLRRGTYTVTMEHNHHA
ncbi:hypothetical protein QJS10_CPB13g01698 [Acorus calamus]|uniref:Uncharacterized protein n=1 Tax=Acorus calamus TaxID=4465 RepID=A0AAV9DJY0_ACOCL|nr:hypothetical protein QJS10_CPB13g01698 [Acorus calamus]